MRIIQSLRERLSAFLLTQQVRAGLKTWGRQPPKKSGAASRVRATIQAKVIRKDGTIEDLGTIYDSKKGG